MSVHPNFRINVDYKFEDYEILKQEAKNILGACTDPFAVRECIETQLNSINAKHKGMRWQYGEDCTGETDLPEEFTDFLFYFENCLSAATNNCYCSEAPRFGDDISHFEIQEAYGKVYVVGMQGNKEAYRSEPYEGVQLDTGAIDRGTSRYFSIDDDEWIRRDAQGKLGVTELVMDGCVADVKSIYPFCVKSEQDIKVYEGGRLVDRKIEYRFALMFGSKTKLPPAGGTVIPGANPTIRSADVVTKVGGLR
jgi:hypothetical protein